MDATTTTIRLGRCRHFLTLIPLQDRLQVRGHPDATNTLPGDGQEWQQPTDEIRSALLQPDIAPPDDTKAAGIGILMFSIPPALAAEFGSLAEETAAGAKSPEASRVEHLVDALRDFFNFTTIPIHGDVSISLDLEPAPESSDDKLDIGTDLDRAISANSALINVGTRPCRILYQPCAPPHDRKGDLEADNGLLARIPLNSGEGIIAFHTGLSARVLADDASPLRILRIDSTSD